jgi:hypothetical protein
MWRPIITTTNPISNREYRLSDDYGRQWFSAYAPGEASGFGYLTWKCRRRVGHDYPDLGHGFPVVMRKGPFRVLFSGQIVRITETSGSGGDEIEIWALGWVHVAKADTYNHIYCDTRWAQWVSSEIPSGSFRPDRFDWDTNNRLYFKPRRGVDYDENDYTRLRYTFQFGEVATRFVASYDIALPGSWPGKLEVRDSGGNVLWSKAVTEEGTIDVTTSGSPTYFEVRFYCTDAGENTAEDDTVYGKLTGVKVFSVNVSTLDAKVIADDIVDLLSVEGHGLSSDTTKVESPGRVLEPCFFDTDMSLTDVMNHVCQFGDSNDVPLVWGVMMDDTRRLFLEPMDLTNVPYVISPHRAELSRGGDWSESIQKAYGIYTDSEGNVSRTVDMVSQDVIDDLGGYYRRQGVQISGTASGAFALEAVGFWLCEHDEPITSGRFTVKGGVRKPDGRFVPFDEVQPGGLMQVEEWRAHEATLTPNDYRDNVTTHPLSGVKVDEDALQVELIPRFTDNLFERYMAVISKLRQEV